MIRVREGAPPDSNRVAFPTCLGRRHRCRVAVCRQQQQHRSPSLADIPARTHMAVHVGTTGELMCAGRRQQRGEKEAMESTRLTHPCVPLPDTVEFRGRTASCGVCLMSLPSIRHWCHGEVFVRSQSYCEISAVHLKRKVSASSTTTSPFQLSTQSSQIEMKYFSRLTDSMSLISTYSSSSIRGGPTHTIVFCIYLGIYFTLIRLDKKLIFY